MIAETGCEIRKKSMISGIRKSAGARYHFLQLWFAKKKIDHRLKWKYQKGEKINIVFVCHRPAVWGALHSVYDALSADSLFCVKILAIPNKKELPDLGFSHDVYETEGAEAFWKEYHCINGYDYATKKWFDLKELKPDYVFFQQPYDVMRCYEYRSNIVSRYAKICYVSYFAPCEYGKQYDECLPEDFLRNVSFFFSQNTVDDRYVKKRIKHVYRGMTKVFLTGYPKYDYAKKYASAKKHQDGQYRMIWTPRWTTNEGLCSFFEYKDKLLEYCKNHMDTDLVFRPHPQAFLEWRSTGELSEEEYKLFLQKISDQENVHIDQSGDYYPLLYSSDCLLTDMSSIVFDYLLTGNPIILCMPDNVQNYYEDVMDGLYRVSSWDELLQTLAKLKNGDDPLLKTRKEIITKRMNISEEGAGRKIAGILRNDLDKLQ